MAFSYIVYCLEHVHPTHEHFNIKTSVTPDRINYTLLYKIALLEPLRPQLFQIPHANKVQRSIAIE